MDMKMRTLEFDGSPEEFSKVSHMFTGVPEASVSSSKGRQDAAEIQADAPRGQITPEIVLRVLNRRSLSSSMRKVLKALVKAPTGGLTTSEIAEAVGISRAELAGVFGAFGRRVANTAGWPAGVAFAEYARDDDDDKARWRYWLPQAFHEALNSGKFKL
jgi:hypothetical protein